MLLSSTSVQKVTHYNVIGSAKPSMFASKFWPIYRVSKSQFLHHLHSVTMHVEIFMSVQNQNYPALL